MTTNLIIEDPFRNLDIKGTVKIKDLSINVPTKYFGNVFMGTFPISTNKVKDIIKTDKLKPIEIIPEKSLVAITIFYNHETPVGPYKEIVLSIPVLYNTKIAFPLLPLLFKTIFKNYGYYVILVASDTDLSREEGEIFGYNHYEKNINVEFKNTESFFSAQIEEGNKKILSLKVNKLKNERIERTDYQTYFINNNHLYKIEMNTIAIVARSLNKNNGILELGSHEITNILKSLEIMQKPIEVSYYRNSIEILNLPKDLGEV
ncbi:MAG: hypothetical protein NC828_06045 [Candidatus Omnitrophica bacterium]|nr:hypothetical protein [Candidatus Omnitrophota bacterium]